MRILPPKGLFLVVVGLALAARGQHAASVKFVTEYRYPTRYEVTPVTGTRNGQTVILGGIVTPTDFVTREVGVAMSVAATAVNLARTDVLPSMEHKRLHGSTDLMIAATSGDLNAVRRLLARGASVNAKNRQWSTALMGACAGGFEDVVRLLLARRAYVNAKSKSGSTPLIFAARNGHASVAGLLLRKGARINARPTAKRLK